MDKSSMTANRISPVVLLAFAILCLLPQASWAKRGRVQVSGKTIVSDMGTLLRGCYHSVDLGGDFPSKQDLHEMTTVYGLNALHVYLETFFDAEVTPGRYSAQGDSIVKWTGEENIYCVLVIGCGWRNGESSMLGATNFWNYYAGRYKDETHVIYEIQNEPTRTMPFPDSTIAMERAAYEIIRTKAPQTHVILFSFIGIADTQATRQTMEAANGFVDWSNASVGYHSYESSEAGIGAVAARRPCINTEFWNGNVYTVNTAIVAYQEQQQISWLSFVSLERVKENFKANIDSAHITWAPDYGSWPLPHAAIAVRQSHAAHVFYRQAAGAFLPFSIFRPYDAACVVNPQGRICPQPGSTTIAFQKKDQPIALSP